MEQCDVVCLLYDAADPDSFSPIAGVFVSDVGRIRLVVLGKLITLVFICCCCYHSMEWLF